MIASSGFYVSDYINVEGNTDYCLQLWKSDDSRYWYGVHFYDSSKNYISNGYISKYSTGKHLTEKMTTPSAAAYARISYRTLYERIKFEKGNIATDYSQADEDVVAISSQTAITQLKNSISIMATTAGKSAGIVISVADEQAAAGTIDLSGLVSFTDLSTSGSTQINGDNITTGIIKSANYIESSDYIVSGSKLNLNDGSFASRNLSWTSTGKLTASEAEISGKIYASSGTFTGKVMASSGKIGTFTIENGGLVYYDEPNSYPGTSYTTYLQPLKRSWGLNQPVIGAGYNNLTAKGVSSGSGEYWAIYANGKIDTQNKIECAGSNYPHIYGNGTVLTLGWSNNASNYGVVLQNGYFRPNYDNYYSLGNSSYRWGNIYSSTGSIITSDRNEKNTISRIDREKAKDFVMGLIPSSYKYNSGTSDRRHCGFIAQDVEDLMHTLGIESKDFAGFIKSPKTKTVNEKTLEEEIIPDEYTYALRYDEFVAPAIAVIQEHEVRIRELETDLLKANTMIEYLINNQKNYII